jgi:hypothetical protein
MRDALAILPKSVQVRGFVQLRFHLLARQPRITYWLAPGRRIILLTVFRKTRGAEAAEAVRALQAHKTCEAEHGPAHDTFDREAS